MRKIAFLCLSFILALGALGVGYAMWFDTLAIEGVIDTGEVVVNFTSQYDNDAGSGQNDPNEEGEWLDVDIDDPYWSGTRYTKHVASTGSTFDDHYAKISIANGYPSYWGSTLWDITNVGTIPVKLWSQTLVELSLGQTEWVMDIDLDIGTRYYVDVDTLTVDTTLDAGDDFSFILSAHDTDQIDPITWEGNPQDWMNFLGYLDVTIHVEQDAEEKTSYDFTINYVFAQWNEES